MNENIENRCELCLKSTKILTKTYCCEKNICLECLLKIVKFCDFCYKLRKLIDSKPIDSLENNKIFNN